MPYNEHAALKDYANAFGLTMSEVMYEATKSFMHRHRQKCSHIQAVMSYRNVPKDKRLEKECWGEDCFTCTHSTSCRTGLYQGVWEKDEMYKELHNDGYAD